MPSMRSAPVLNNVMRPARSVPTKAMVRAERSRLLTMPALCRVSVTSVAEITTVTGASALTRCTSVENVTALRPPSLVCSCASPVRGRFCSHEEVLDSRRAGPRRSAAPTSAVPISSSSVNPVSCVVAGFAAITVPSGRVSTIMLLAVSITARV